MALYDLTRIDWSNGTCNLDNIYYLGGFSNTLFFPEDLQAPQYEIEDDVKKADGLNNAKRQVWAKKLTLRIVHIESIADELSILPLHETVIVTDKEGNAYVCAGADIVVDIQQEGEGETLTDHNKYPLMAVEITFNAHQIIKTACCNTSMAAVTCSATLPTIDTVTEPAVGQMLITGTAPTGHQVRLFQRELFEQVTAEVGGKVNDACWDSATVGYCCTNAGKIYKTVDAGNVWTLVYNGVIALSAIAFDGLTVYAGGIVNAGETTLVVSADAGVTWTPIIIGNQGDITAFDAYNGSYLVFCTTSGKVFRYDGSLNNVSPAGAGTLRDICINKNDPSQIMVVGVNYYAYTANSGAAWTTYVTAIDMYCVTFTTNAGYWIFGDSAGKTYITANYGATIITNTTFAARCCGLTWRAFGGSSRYFACDVNGNVKYSDTAGATWSTGWKTKAVSTVNRIRAYNSADMQLFLAIGNGKVATTETGIDAVVPVVIGSEYSGSGITYNAVNNVSYELQVQTLTFETDPCNNSLITIFTT